jgi:hypothetical protein
MPLDRHQRPITDIESDLLDCLLKCPKIDRQDLPTPSAPTDDYRKLDCHSIARLLNSPPILLNEQR